MRAVRLVQPGTPLEEADVAIPEIGPSDVLIRVAACGICHSDAHYRGGISKFEALPMTLGHEVAGHVASVGKDVSHVAPEIVSASTIWSAADTATSVRGVSNNFAQAGR